MPRGNPRFWETRNHDRATKIMHFCEDRLCDLDSAGGAQSSFASRFSDGTFCL
jgi:hypothetical protein